MTTALKLVCTETVPVEEGKLWLRCPKCLRAIGPISDQEQSHLLADQRCSGCGTVIYKMRGVWRSLVPSRREQLAPFIGTYEGIRFAEGRGSCHPAFYLALPLADLTGRFPEQWQIRARTFRYLERRILPRLEKKYGSHLRILDIGAGNGWLSYRLSLHGYRPAAVDLCCNDWDGLEAAEHYASVLPEFFPRFEAEMDDLPFSDGQFDVAIFNASFHYSTSYEQTMLEIIRCLRPGGTVLILDSPTYSDATGGETMRHERGIQLEVQSPLRGDPLPTADYLTPGILESLGRLGIFWTRHQAWYSLRWWLRPVIARLKRRREPSQFYIYEGQVDAS